MKEGEGILSNTDSVVVRVKLPAPSGKAKYLRRPIVHQYRKGKVKSSLRKGLKET